MFNATLIFNHRSTAATVSLHGSSSPVCTHLGLTVFLHGDDVSRTISSANTSTESRPVKACLSFISAHMQVFSYSSAMEMELCQTPISHIHIYHKMNVNGVCVCVDAHYAHFLLSEVIFFCYTTVIKAGEMSRCRRRRSLV